MILYEIKVAYERQTGEDTPGKVKETYLLEGVSCADVETRLLSELKPYISGDCEVGQCKQVQYYDILPATSEDLWFKARVELITIQDDGKETRRRVSVLVQAATIIEALHTLKSYLAALDCEIVSITRSPILDVFRAVK